MDWGLFIVECRKQVRMAVIIIDKVKGTVTWSYTAFSVVQAFTFVRALRRICWSFCLQRPGAQEVFSIG